MRTNQLVFGLIGLVSIFGLSLSASAQHSGDAEGGLLYEPWPNLTPDATWRFQPFCDACIPAAGDFTSKAEVREYAPGEFAFHSRGPDTWWETTGDVTNGFAVQNRWHQYVLGEDMFTRGNNLTCTWTFWGDPNDPAWAPEHFGPNGPIAWPGNSGVLGPFHRNSATNHSGLFYPTLEAGLEVGGIVNWKFQTSGAWQTAIFDDEHGTFGVVANSGAAPGTPTKVFHDVILAATSPANAIVARVILDDNDGAAFSYRSLAKGPAFIEIFDNRGVGSDPDPHNDVWIGFASDLGALYVDNIIVEDDNNVRTGPAGPTPTPTNTAIVGDVENWDSYE